MRLPFRPFPVRTADYSGFGLPECGFVLAFYSGSKRLLSKRWIPTGTRLEGPKLEPKGPKAEVKFPTADQGFSSIQGTLFGFFWHLNSV